MLCQTMLDNTPNRNHNSALGNLWGPLPYRSIHRRPHRQCSPSQEALNLMGLLPIGIFDKIEPTQ